MGERAVDQWAVNERRVRCPAVRHGVRADLIALQLISSQCVFSRVHACVRAIVLAYVCARLYIYRCTAHLPARTPCGEAGGPER